ncbi:MAG: 4-hydroxybenzoate octaprenyltransferase, partial [Desulfobacteraceae bacterium]
MNSTSIIRKILQFTKVEHTAFSLPLIFCGAYLGAGSKSPDFSVLMLIFLAAVGARIFGMAFNRIFDRHLDALNPRTAQRELPSGRLSLTMALIVAFGGLAGYLLACLFLGGYCLMLSPIPLIPLLGYSLLKRFTAFCHFGIGFCLALAPLGAFVAASNSLQFTSTVLLFSMFVFFWLSGSDIIYAILDISSDRRNKIYSLPATVGAKKALRISGGVHATALACLVLVLLTSGGGALGWFFLGLTAAIMILLYVPGIPIRTRFFPISTLA